MPPVKTSDDLGGARSDRAERCRAGWVTDGPITDPINGPIRDKARRGWKIPSHWDTIEVSSSDLFLL